MQVEISLRADIALEMAKGELKQRLTEVIDNFAEGKDLPAELVRPSPTRPGVFIAKISSDHLMFYQRREDAIRVMDIVSTPENYR